MCRNRKSESEWDMYEQPDNVNERLVRLKLVVKLVPDMVKATQSALKVLGDITAVVDNLAGGQSAIASRTGEVAVRVGGLQQAIADTERTFKETRDRILEGVQDLEIHLATIEERLATLEDETLRTALPVQGSRFTGCLQP